MHQMHLGKEEAISCLLTRSDLYKEGSNEHIPVFLGAGNKLKAFTILLLPRHN